jgi:hypothetical protein
MKYSSGSLSMNSRGSNGVKKLLQNGADAWNFSQGALIAIWTIPHRIRSSSCRFDGKTGI